MALSPSVRDDKVKHFLPPIERFFYPVNQGAINAQNMISSLDQSRRAPMYPSVSKLQPSPMHSSSQGISEFSPDAMKFLERIAAHCERQEITPRELFESIAACDSRRAPCCSVNTLHDGLLQADPTMKEAVFDEVYKSINSDCETHKKVCVQPVKFDEVIVNAQNHGLHRNKHSAKIGMSIFRSTVTKMDEDHVSFGIGSPHSGFARQPNTYLKPMEYNLRHVQPVSLDGAGVNRPDAGQSAFRSLTKPVTAVGDTLLGGSVRMHIPSSVVMPSPGFTIGFQPSALPSLSVGAPKQERPPARRSDCATRPRSPSGAAVDPAKRARILSLAPDMQTFLDLGGNKETGLLEKSVFIERIKEDGLNHGWKIPVEFVEARWHKVDPVGTGTVNFRQYQEAFLLPKMHKGATSGPGLGHGKVGLVNIGNTCYMNASLQCIRSCRDLTNLLLDGKFVETQLNTGGFLGSKGDVAMKYCQLLQLLEASAQRNEQPRDFKNSVSRVGPQFAGSRQQDAQEFVGFLLDMLHEDFNRVKKKPYIEQADITNEMIQEKGLERCAAMEWYHYLKRDKSLIVDSFQGQLKSVLTCSVCRYALTKFESFMFLSVPTITVDDRKLESLHACLEEFSNTEKLTGDNQWYCQKCKRLQDAEKIMTIWKLPKYLILHLKRFTTKQSANSMFTFVSSKPTFTKVSHGVTIPMDMTFTSVLPAESPQKTSPNYRLLSFVKHFGSSSYGHYTAYCRHADESWQLFDDDSVTTLNSAEIPNRAKDSYVYFFERCHSRLQDEVLNLQDAAGGLPRQTQSRPELWPHVAEHGRQWSFLDDEVVSP
eukprot:GEMP01012443.1.p1 GENE.GEMP01012443.1~~GEMP01012443.1.p1  ORF type:complete len:821 (+),score=146.33 GEMP01012443.1:120-2582(+)